MSKITFAEFEQVMSCDLAQKGDPCIEIEFCIDDSMEYENVFMEKVIAKNTKRDLYGFGLAQDGSQEYNFETFQEFANAKIFYGSKSLKEIWDLVSIWSLGGGPVHDMLPILLNLAQKSDKASDSSLS